MLVLSRAPRQSIVFPTLGISIEVLHVGKKKVRVGIDAPADVAVHRREVADRIDREGFCYERATTNTGRSGRLPR